MESECGTAINLLHNNKRTVNPDKLQVILLDIDVEIGNEKIKSTSSVKLLEVHIDDKLNFNHYINKLLNLLKSAKCSNTTKVILRSSRKSGFSQQFHILKF